MSGIPIRRVIWALLAAYTIAHLGYSVVRYSIFTGQASGDFNRVYQEAAYWEDPQADQGQAGVWHPPFYYWLLMRLDKTAGGQKPLAYFLYFSQFLLFPLAVRWLARAARLDAQPLTLLYLVAAALAVNFQPFLETLAQHKVEGWEFCLIALAIACYRRKKDLLCGAAVAFAANLKFLPGVLAIFFLVKREYKVMLGMLAAELAILALLAGSQGFERLWFSHITHPAEMIFSHRHEGTLPEASVEMQTLTGAVTRLFARPKPGLGFMHYIETENYMPVPAARTAQSVSGGLRLLALALWLYFIRRKRAAEGRERAWPRIQLELALTLVMILLLSQLARVHYGILVLPAFVLVGLLLAQRRHLFGAAEKSLFIAAYGFSAMLVPGGLLNHLPPLFFWGSHYSDMYLWLSLPVWGYLLLATCIVLCAKKLASATPAAK